MLEFLSKTATGCRQLFPACSSRTRTPLSLWLAAVVISSALSATTYAADQPRRPNIIFVMADDLGYGDLGCYGQSLIETPSLDQMAAEGMKFRQFYAGNTVCAPSRAVLMTGKHMGHVHVRGNAGADIAIQTLRDADVTVAEVLHEAGYATALCGKWGLGDEHEGGLTGIPNRQGFDVFFGYLNQVHAHNYYPEFLWNDRQQLKLRNVVEKVGRPYAAFEGGAATKRLDYSHDLIAARAMQFINDQAAKPDQPFFLYLALTIPHANNEGTRLTGNGQEVPDFGQYVSRDWPDQDKGQAAMISRMDDDLGRLFRLLRELQMDDQTLVMFTSDNGPHNEGGHDVSRFNPGGPLRGMKRDLYEAGIRVPFIVRWPGTTPANSISDHIGYSGDLLATVAELSGGTTPEGLDSISFAAEITGHHAQQQPHDHLYWEFYERGGAQAVVKGHWKAVRKPMFEGPIEIYDLATDLGEAHDVAAEHPELVQEMAQIMAHEHQDHPQWKPSGNVPKNQPQPGHGQAPF